MITNPPPDPASEDAIDEILAKHLQNIRAGHDGKLKQAILAYCAKRELEARIKVYREVIGNMHHSEFKSYILELYNNDLEQLKQLKAQDLHE